MAHKTLIGMLFFVFCAQTTTAMPMAYGSQLSALSEMIRTAKRQSTRKDMEKTIRDLLVGIEDSIKGEEAAVAVKAQGACTDKLGADNVVAEKEMEFSDGLSKFQTLSGCEPGSTCETDTDSREKAATTAFDAITALTRDLDLWEPQVAKLKSDVEALGGKKTENEGTIAAETKLHEDRLAKFTNAMTILGKIRDSLDEITGKITTPQFVTADEQKVLENFKVASAVLLMVSQQATATADPALVKTLKDLLTSCMGHLQKSHDNEVKAHNDWLGLQSATGTDNDDEIKRINGEIDALTKKINDHKTNKDLQIGNKNDALTNSDRIRGQCIQGNTDFIAGMADFARELAAITEMYKILEQANLNDATVKVAFKEEETPAPVVEEPAAPVVEEPAAPVVEEPAAPVVEEPAAPVVEEPAAPVVEEPAAPVVEEPGTEVPV